MEIEENKQVVLDWIQSGCNYEQGAMLYSQFGKNSFLKKDFPGKQHKHATKIIYELCKSVGLECKQRLFCDSVFRFSCLLHPTGR